MYKFKRKDNKFVWEGDSMILEYSNPSIQAFTNYSNINSINDIMYYYYTVKLYKKYENKKINEIELVSEKRTGDFPCIDQLESILNDVLNIELNNNTSQKIKYKNGNCEYVYITNTDGFGCDDFYRIEKRKYNDNIFYNLYIGCAIDDMIDMDSVGINIFNLKEEDIIELQKCVKEFIKYSIEEYNKELKRDKYYRIIHNSIYEYDIHGKLTNIIKKEDFADVIYLKDNRELEYINVLIEDIGDNFVVINGSTMDIYNIPDIFRVVQEDRLKYNEIEIAKDLINVLDDFMLNDFKELDKEMLFDEYCELIINRTWMCRDEHKYIENYEINKGLPHAERMKEVVMVVIDKIKQML